MINFDFDKNCTGCQACFNVCPKNAIEMVDDEKGFKVPRINKKKCINCGLCEKVCPFLNRNNHLKENEIRAYLYSSSNVKDAKNSSSGAAFYDLACSIIKHGGYVAGCVYDENLMPYHIVSNNICDIQRMQGSKYIQSDIKECYKEIKQKLIAGKTVLFSGTPCQCRAVSLYFNNYSNGKYRNNLIIVGLICHGIASPKVWKSYKTYLEEEENEKLINVNFRDKTKKGYKRSYCKYTFESGKNVFYPTYFPGSKYIESTIVYNLGLRNSCSACVCKGIDKGCDIILGDWYEANKGKGKYGTSCIVTMSNLGLKVVKESLIEIQPIGITEIEKKNSFIIKSVKQNINNGAFFAHLEDKDFWKNVEKYYPPKYKYKKILIKIGAYGCLKKILNLIGK